VGAIPPGIEKAPFLIVEGYAVDIDELTDPQKEVLGKFAERILLRMSHLGSVGVLIAIDGHTDSTGTEPYNKGLGMRRAKNVEQHLRLRLGGSVAARIAYESKSYGFSNPREPNRTTAGRDRNRRVEVRTAWKAIAKPKPRTPSTKPPPLVLQPRVLPAPCIDLEALLRHFRPAVARWTEVMSATRLIWPGEGSPLTLSVAKSRLETISADVLDKVVGEIRGGLDVLKLGVAESALEVFGQLSRDQTNREIMSEPSDARRNDRHRKLAWRMVAEETARERRANPMAEYLRLWRLWEELNRLTDACNKAQGRRRQTDVRKAAPEARRLR
jgi:hypothetical protein